MTVMVEMEDVVKVYGRGTTQVQALRGLNITVEKGQFVVIMGPSGSGKTTLLNMIGGIDSPTGGSVRVNGQELAEANEFKLDEYRLKTIGFVFQSLNLVPSLSARENIELPMFVTGIEKSVIAERTDNLLEMVQMTYRSGHRPHQLSLGEQQRIAVVAALANDPAIILADEPTGNLDSHASQNLISHFRRIVSEMKKTLILVTHDPVMARKGDWIYMITDGRIVSRMKPSEVGAAEGSCDDYLRHRLQEVEAERAMIDRLIQRSEIGADDFMKRRSTLQETRRVLSNELLKLGQIHSGIEK